MSVEWEEQTHDEFIQYSAQHAGCAIEVDGRMDDPTFGLFHVCEADNGFGLFATGGGCDPDTAKHLAIRVAELIQECALKRGVGVRVC